MHGKPVHHLLSRQSQQNCTQQLLQHCYEEEEGLTETYNSVVATIP